MRSTGRLASLPEHLRLLLDRSTDGDASTAPEANVERSAEAPEAEVDEDASQGWGDDGDDVSLAVHESSSVAGDGSASTQSIARTLETARQAALPPQDEVSDAAMPSSHTRRSRSS
jgi:hypothetical protein